MLQPYLFSDMSNICTVLHTVFFMLVALYVTNMHAYNLHIGISGIYAQIGVGIFGSGTYLSVRCEVDVAVSCILVYVLRNVGSVCPFSIMTGTCVFNGAVTFAVIYDVYVQCSLHILLIPVISYV